MKRRITAEAIVVGLIAIFALAVVVYIWYGLYHLVDFRPAESARCMPIA